MPAQLPPSFWEEESRRLVAVLLPHITALAMEGIQNGAAKVGITINYAIYSLLAEQWAREYTDQLLKNVRTTNEAVVGDILANWIAMPGRTIGDLRAALEPWFGTKRADVIAITEATRALASGELMAFQRAGVEEIRWGTNHDELVCPLCGPLHGQVRKIGEPFGYFKWRKNAAPEPVFVPPYHPNCRCGISPVVKLRRVSFASVPNTLIIANTLAMVRPVGVYEMIKGDFEGHPFRGNQWVDGESMKHEEIKTKIKGTKVSDTEGNPILVFHGTNSKIDKFKTDMVNRMTGEVGAYFTSDKGYAYHYGNRIYSAYIDIKKPFVGTKKPTEDGQKFGFFTEKARRQLIDKGYDGVITIVNGKMEEVVPFYPELIHVIEG